ncbi:MAG: urease accessory protein UreE, partial [Rhodobacteraceae bacterium]|nr:urease accessory protein UreE [Paracoccaceae bacterium]
MTALPVTRSIRRKGTFSASPEATITLDYEARMLRRKRLVTDDGFAIFVDLAETVSLDEGDCLALEDGRLVGVVAAPETVLAVTGDLPRLAWHIGNRHTPCQIGAGRLLIREDHVLETMLRRLGAGVERAVLPFSPEGGAYGHGRTMGHDHGPAQSHGHG